MQSDPITFKYIRNRICEFSKESLLSIALRVLKKIENDPKEVYPIFHLLSLIKWVAIYGGSKYPPKIANINNFDRLMTQISNLATFSHLYDLRNPKDLDKVLVILAHQQFYLQDELTMAVIWRQIVLYCLINSQYDIQGSFKLQSGLEIIDFFKILFLVYIQANPQRLANSFNYDGSISQTWMQSIDKNTSSETREKFFELLSFGTKESISRLKNDLAKIKNIELQPLDTDFFGQYPFFRYDKIYILHRKLLPHTIRHYIYDFLKEKDCRFSEDFGRRMEKYIGMGIKETGMVCLSEAQYKQKFPNCRYQVDYIVSNNILIESKAIELPVLASVLPKEDIVYSSIKDSLVKAYVFQMLSVANSLNSSEEYFGIIVTYKKLYINMALEWNSLFKAKTEQFCTENNLMTDLLPRPNLFIFDLDTWDLIIQLIVERKTSLIDLLKFFRSQNINDETKGFEATMYLKDYWPINVNLSFHKEAESLFKFKE